MKRRGFEYRDVSLFFQMLRELLLGRPHNLHNRFPPALAPRTIPTPDIPRGPNDGYAKKYYYTRSASRSVKPPVVAPVAEGPPIKRDPTMKAEAGGISPDSVRLLLTLLTTPQRNVFWGVYMSAYLFLWWIWELLQTRGPLLTTKGP